MRMISRLIYQDILNAIHGQATVGLQGRNPIRSSRNFRAAP